MDVWEAVGVNNVSGTSSQVRSNARGKTEATGESLMEWDVIEYTKMDRHRHKYDFLGCDFRGSGA